MTGRLPSEAHDLVSATLAAARLPARDHAVVRLELESHFLDGLAAGESIVDLVAGFGNPAITAQLIRRARRRFRRRIGAWVVGPALAVAACYLGAVLRLMTAPAGTGAPALETEARYVAESAAHADSVLRTPAGIVESFRVAAALRDRRSLWAETASLIILDRAMAAADTALPPPEREVLEDSLRALALRATLQPRRDIVTATLPLVVERLYGVDGRIDREGLRLLRHTKGVGQLSAWAALLEPVYFARAVRRAELQRTLDRLIAARLASAELAGRRLAARL